MKYFICQCIFESKLGCGFVDIHRLIEDGFIDHRFMLFLKMTVTGSAAKILLTFCLNVIVKEIYVTRVELSNFLLTVLIY